MFNNYINNLSIRYKLILFLIIPVLTILYFSLSGIYLKFEQQQEGKKLLEFVQISYQLDDLMHELQKERGISAGFIGSGGKSLHEELRDQRQLTDDKFRLFSLELAAKGAKKNYWGFPDVFSHSNLNQYTLTVIRNDVDNINNTEFFENYSKLIITGFDIIRHLQVITSDAKIARQSEAYTSLLLLQERSGQERGLLNGIFASGKLDAKRFKLFTGHISDQEALFKNFYAIASKKQQAILQKKMKSTEIEDVETLRTAAIYKATRNDKLNSLLAFIGYGGLIHNFKNYVIRGELRYANKFNTVYKAAIKTINQYQELPGMSKKEIHSLNIIKNTFGKYKSLLDNTRRLRDNGHIVTEIDFVVKVDDRPALEAIEYLHKSVTGLDTSKWWEKASLRIELIREASNSVRADIDDLVRHNLSSATRSLYLYLVLTLFSLMITFILGYLFVRYLIGSIINIATHMSKMQKKGEFELLNIRGTDEINQVAEAFNSLIIEHRKYDEQLKLAAMVFDKASEAMVITDADNQFIKINAAFTSITGYSFDDVKGYTPAILKSGKQNDDFYKKMWGSLEQHGNWSGEILNIRKNGEIYSEWLNINVIKNKQGEIIKHIAMFSDITELKKQEEKQSLLQRQLLQAQKMESLGQLTGGIAHDFNNILSAILGYTSLARELDDDNVKLDNYLNEVLLAGSRAKDLVIQMLTFSRSGKDIIVFKLVDIDSLLIETLKMIRPILPSTIEIISHISNDVEPVMANPVMINQVVMNLCINARDAINEHGRIDLGLRSVSINNEDCSSCHKPISGDFLEISVKDTGSGIEPANIKNLFDPFFSTKQMGHEKGTGMGLAMVHGILHDHSGHIIVESTLGKGSNFRLLFPLASVSDIAENKVHSISESIEATTIESTDEAKGHNVLLVDDEESIVLLMTELLKKYGFKVTGYVDSEQALAHFRENKDKYALVITDQTMPKLTGTELSKALIEIQPDISIILCSGLLEKEGAESIGIKAYMTKPVNMKELFNTITKILS